MCFSPQWRGLFRHLNFQKVSECGVLCPFWLPHVLGAATACNFSTSQLPKMVRTWNCFFTFWLANVHRATTACNWSSLIWPATSAPAALASLLFNPPEPQNIGKTQCFETSLPFLAPASSLFWLSPSLIFSLVTFSTSEFLPGSASSWLCFSCVHIVEFLVSKLPSKSIWK